MKFISLIFSYFCVSALFSDQLILKEEVKDFEIFPPGVSEVKKIWRVEDYQVTFWSFRAGNDEEPKNVAAVKKEEYLYGFKLGVEKKLKMALGDRVVKFDGDEWIDIDGPKFAFSAGEDDWWIGAFSKNGKRVTFLKALAVKGNDEILFLIHDLGSGKFFTKSNGLFKDMGF